MLDNPRSRAAVFGLLILGISLASLWADLHNSQVPTDSQALEAAVASISTDFQAGDAVAVTPMWNDGVWTMLAGIGPGAERYPFPALLRGEYLDPADVLTFDRVWVIGTLDNEPIFSALQGEDFHRGDLTLHGHGVSVRPYISNRTSHLAKLTETIERLQVTRGPLGEDQQVCPFSRGAHRCGGASWLDISVQQHDVFHRDVRWLFAHAGPDDHVLTITWPDAPRGHFLLRAGFTQASTRRQAGSPLHLTVEVDGTQRLRRTFEPTDYRLARLLISPEEENKTMTVTLTIQAERSSWRQLMVEGDIFEHLHESLRESADQHADTP